MTLSIIKQLEIVLEDRKSASKDSSYVASLYEKGLDQILKKLGEESIETIMAAKDDHRDQIIYESTDVIFHLLVLLRYKNIEFSEIEAELARRFGLSGIEEKSQRSS